MRRLRNTLTVRFGLALPLLLLSLSGVVLFQPLMVIFALPALAVLYETPGKYPSLLLAAALWLFGAALLGAVLPSWGVCAVVFVAALIVLAPVVRVGQDWGERRCARMARAGRPMLDWEWVYVGRSFAQGHALNRITPALILVGVAVVAVSGLFWWRLIDTAVPPHPSLWVGVAALYLLTLLALLRRWPVAYPLVHLTLVPGLPLTLPVIVYWADGIRPNLIYRHRFERLVPYVPRVPPVPKESPDV
ncbi:MAG: hypothetical protein AB8B82_06145 [Roseovarius sp.]